MNICVYVKEIMLELYLCTCVCLNNYVQTCGCVSIYFYIVVFLNIFMIYFDKFWNNFMWMIISEFDNVFVSISKFTHFRIFMLVIAFKCIHVFCKI